MSGEKRGAATGIGGKSGEYGGLEANKSVYEEWSTLCAIWNLNNYCL